MYRENALELHYDLLEIFGEQVLFSGVRIDESTVPEGYNMYELRSTDDGAYPVELSHFIRVNYFGTILTRANLLNGKVYRLITPGDYNFFGREAFITSDGDIILGE